MSPSEEDFKAAQAWLEEIKPFLSPENMKFNTFVRISDDVLVLCLVEKYGAQTVERIYEMWSQMDTGKKLVIFPSTIYVPKEAFHGDQGSGHGDNEAGGPDSPDGDDGRRERGVRQADDVDNTAGVGPGQAEADPGSGGADVGDGVAGGRPRAVRRRRTAKAAPEQG